MLTHSIDGILSSAGNNREYDIILTPNSTNTTFSSGPSDSDSFTSNSSIIGILACKPSPKMDCVYLNQSFAAAAPSSKPIPVVSMAIGRPYRQLVPTALSAPFGLLSSATPVQNEWISDMRQPRKQKYVKKGASKSFIISDIHHPLTEAQQYCLEDSYRRNTLKSNVQFIASFLGLPISRVMIFIASRDRLQQYKDEARRNEIIMGKPNKGRKRLQ